MCLGMTETKALVILPTSPHGQLLIEKKNGFGLRTRRAMSG
jgi:hypothetical protein